MKKEIKKKRSIAGIKTLLESKTQEQLSEVSSTGGMAYSAMFRANQLKKEADKILALDNPIKLTPGNEALPPEVEDAREDEFYGIRETLKPGADFINLNASYLRVELLDDLNCLIMGIDAADSINPKNSFEKMLIHEASACHSICMSLLSQAQKWGYMSYDRLHDQKKNVDIQVKLITASGNLMDKFNRSLQTILKLRSSGKQNMTIQYSESIKEVVEFALGNDPVVAAVLELMNDNEGWKSSPTELLETLGFFVPEKIKKSRQWPKRAHILSGKLKRAASFLEEMGIEVITGIKEGKGERKIVIRKITKNSTSCATHNENRDKMLNRI